MRVVITGSNGFVAAHVIEHLLKNTDWEIVGFDKMSDVSKPNDRLMDMDTWDKYQDRVTLYPIDLNLPIPNLIDKEIGKVDYILHLAAESHVDRSIEEPKPFILNNVTCTLNMLEYARKHPELKMFVNFSTDEVYGPAPDKDFKSWQTVFTDFPQLWSCGADTITDKGYPEFFYHHPSNPYSASKSAQEAIGIAYSNTYKVPVVTTHTMNIFGERQHPEKFVPMVIRKVLNGETVTIHADKTKTKAGSRFYLHARNLAAALLHIVNLGYKGYDEWNIAGLKEVDNLTLAKEIARYVGKELKYEMTDFHSSRPGHDLRYALDSTKLINSGFEYDKTFEESLESTVKWTVERRTEWL